MKAVKIAALLATSGLIALLVLVFAIESPMQDQYREKVDSLMAIEGFDSETEVLIHYPALMEIKNMMDRESDLDYLIQCKIRGPMAGTSATENLELQQQMEELKQLRIDMRSALKHKMIPYEVASL